MEIKDIARIIKERFKNEKCVSFSCYKSDSFYTFVPGIVEDFRDDMYKVDKVTGEITEYDFLDYSARSYPENEELEIYYIDELLKDS